MKIFCVIICYNPDIEQFKRVMDSIVANTDHFLIVDNNSKNIEKITQLYPKNIKPLIQNLGIASAQNIGIKVAIENKADYVWLSDQDTVYPREYLTKMLESIKTIENQNKKLGAIGPSFLDKTKNNLQPFIRFTPFSEKFFSDSPHTSVSQLIASGMIIPATVFSQVGLKADNLFIDWVDLEWCWRAKNKGYEIFGNGKVVIKHTLGDDFANVFGRKIAIRTPFRHYHIVRNGIFLSLHSPYLNYFMKLEIFFKTLSWVFVYPLISKEKKLQHLSATLKGFYDGLLGNLS